MLFGSSGPFFIQFRNEFTTFLGADSGYAEYQVFPMGFLAFSRDENGLKSDRQNKAIFDAFRVLGSIFIQFRNEFTLFLGDDSGYAEYQVFLWVYLLFRETKTD